MQITTEILYCQGRKLSCN